MGATIKDVAKRAGVGIATVSRVINGGLNVLPETRERVLAAIAELNYRPNQAARQLVTAKSQTIGVILPFLTRPFFVEILRGIEAATASSNYQLIIFNVESRLQRDRYFSAMPFLGRIDGLIILSLPVGPEEAADLAAALPVVLIDSQSPHLTSLVVDNVAGGRLATEHLLALGHRSIAFVSGPLDPPLGFTNTRARFQGYCEALAEQGLEPDPSKIIHTQDGREAGRQATHTLLGQPSPPTAIFAAGDELAFGILDTLKAQEMLPQNLISVVGYDDLEVARYIGLTTIHQPMEMMGRTGVQLLLEQITTPGRRADTLTLPISLTQRTSTQPLIASR